MNMTARPRRARQPAATAADRLTPRAAAAVVRGTFPIVGIGASAGGLEALGLFLQNVPTGCGMAFVIVQHLDPTRTSMLPALLQQVTPMKVLQVEDRTMVRPDCVYVIPPNKDMSLLGGVLHLQDSVEPRGRRLPIDFFFRSLAADAAARAVGVILSGMGTDGTLGLAAIREAAGAGFVQDPISAKFDGMPRSAMDAGRAAVVAPVEELPARIVAHLQQAPLVPAPELAREDAGHRGFDQVAILLRDQTGHDFSLYKKNTVYRRIERRMGIHRIDRIDAYVRFLRENPLERELLFKELLIGVTGFFRDPAAWDAFENNALPALLTQRAPGQVVRAWIPACATGEEAYTLAIAFTEALERFTPARIHPLQIFATDVDRDAIDRARAGVFPATIAADVSPGRLKRFFVQVGSGYQIAKPIREMVVFAPQDVATDPPFTRLDVVSCRNLLIYLTPELQKKILPLFHYSLNPGGVLFLGRAETIGEFTNLFAELAGEARLYRRLEFGPRTEPTESPVSLTPARTGPAKVSSQPADFQSQAQRWFAQRFSPAAALVNDKGDILFISGQTGRYLEPAAGKANWNLATMAREGLRPALIEAVHQALRRADGVICKNVVFRTDGGEQAVDLTVQAVAEPGALRGLVAVVFADATPPPNATGLAAGPEFPTRGSRLTAREQDLAQGDQDLQVIREAEQALRGDANSSRKALESTSEELQSTNEELITSKEEMQSMNEELQVLNAELQRKVDDLYRLNNDMKNLLDSTEIITVFLDPALQVRLFTAGSSRVFRLIPGDVGRPITDIASDLAYPALADDSREVLRTLAVHEQPVAAHDGRWFLVRIMPYRTLENMIEGVVITFAEITASKTVEADLRATQSDLERHIVEQDLELVKSGEALQTERERGQRANDLANTAARAPETGAAG